MERICLETENCIITGKTATVWTGHVIAECMLGNTKAYSSGNATIAIIAGFENQEIMHLQTSVFGCFGKWKKEDGLRKWLG